QVSPHHRDLHSFPTRRSSDLGQDDKDDLQRFRSELGLDRYELHAGNFHRRQRSVREVCGRLSPEDGEEGKDGKRGKEIIFLVLRSEEHTSELQSLAYLVCRLL